jgi:hypothetical protein
MLMDAPLIFIQSYQQSRLLKQFNDSIPDAHFISPAESFDNTHPNFADVGISQRQQQPVVSPTGEPLFSPTHYFANFGSNQRQRQHSQVLKQLNVLIPDSPSNSPAELLNNASPYFADVGISQRQQQPLVSPTGEPLFLPPLAFLILVPINGNSSSLRSKKLYNFSLTSINNLIQLHKSTPLQQ